MKRFQLVSASRSDCEHWIVSVQVVLRPNAGLG